MTPLPGTDAWALVITAGLLLIRQAHSGVDLLSLLMLVPLLICLIPSLDSLQGTGTIRIWNRWRMRFSPSSAAAIPGATGSTWW